ncbi:MAG TPA: hypothetical protein VEN81_07505 [Planctomycetota bacterium]|nr:hypothetical protein [Planctomycetota bacterium]
MIRRRSVLAAVLALPLALGCDSKSDPKPPSAHGHRAPHGGALVELGQEFGHVEVVLDPVSGTLTGYMLDGEAEGPVRLEEKSLALGITCGPSSFTLRMDAVGNPLTGETPGNSSQFQGQSDRLKGQKEFEAVLESVVFRGRPFSKIAFGYPRGHEGP